MVSEVVGAYIKSFETKAGQMIDINYCVLTVTTVRSTSENEFAGQILHQLRFNDRKKER